MRAFPGYNDTCGLGSSNNKGDRIAQHFNSKHLPFLYRAPFKESHEIFFAADDAHLESVRHGQAVAGEAEGFGVTAYLSALGGDKSAAAAALAAALKEKDSLRGKHIGIVLSGGNVDRETYQGVLAGAL